MSLLRIVCYVPGMYQVLLLHITYDLFVGLSSYSSTRYSSTRYFGIGQWYVRVPRGRVSIQGRKAGREDVNQGRAARTAVYLILHIFFSNYYLPSDNVQGVILFIQNEKTDIIRRIPPTSLFYIEFLSYNSSTAVRVRIRPRFIREPASTLRAHTRPTYSCSCCPFHTCTESSRIIFVRYTGHVPFTILFHTSTMESRLYLIKAIIYEVYYKYIYLYLVGVIPKQWV